MNIPIVILNGSLREGGNTDALVQALLEGAKTTGSAARLFRLREMNIGPCGGCWTCRREERCGIDDDMTFVRASLEAAETIVLASPLYWCEVTSLMKACLDRLYFYHDSPRGGRLMGKRALPFLVLGESENVDYECAVVEEFFGRMIKSLDLKPLASAVFSGLMEKEAARKNPEILKKARALGKALAEDSWPAARDRRMKTCFL